MSTCVSCGSYYRLNAYHTDLYDCQDCVGVLLESSEDLDINTIVNPSGKVQAVFNEEDLNDAS